jgi:hypothetical protein
MMMNLKPNPKVVKYKNDIEQSDFNKVYKTIGNYSNLPGIIQRSVYAFLNANSSSIGSNRI